MRNVLGGFLGLSLLALWGCSESGAPGGPGATKPPAQQAKVGMTEETFTLTVPTMSTHVKQGESKDDTIGVKRGKNFAEDVSVTFEGLPKGVTIDPATTTIKSGDKDAKITIKAADDAAVGDFTVKVMGHPSRGPDATSDLKITVSKK